MQTKNPSAKEHKKANVEEKKNEQIPKYDEEIL
jgi:hypothetical protein